MDTFENGFHRTAVSADTDRWTPVHDGDVFCSPACGHKCKKAEYDHAVAAGNALAAMLGTGWEPEVWENGGWYYAVRKGRGEVRYDGAKFTATIAVDVQISHSATTPRAALENAVAELNERVAMLTRVRSSLAPEPLGLERVNQSEGA